MSPHTSVKQKSFCTCAGIFVWLSYFLILVNRNRGVKHHSHGRKEVIRLVGISNNNETFHDLHPRWMMITYSPFGNRKNNLFIKSKNTPRSVSPSEVRINRKIFQVRENAQGETMMTLERRPYDVGILGCGVGGHAAAINAMESGLKVLLFTGEENDIGGTCVNVGCIPSKSLLYATNKYRELKNMAKLYNYGIYSNLFSQKGKKNNSPSESNQLVADSVQIDIGKLKEYTQSVINKLRGGIMHGLKTFKFSKNSEHVQVIHENGYIIDKNTIKAEKSRNEYKVRNIIIATGSVPNVSHNVEIDQKSVFTSDQAVKLEGLQNYMGIIGMGIIGLEFSDIYTALGSEIISFEHSAQFLPMLDNDVATYFDKVFIKTKPMQMHLNARIQYVKSSRPNKPVVIGYTEGDTKKVADNGANTGVDYSPENSVKGIPIKETYVDSCLIATGRKANTENIGLEKMKIQTNRGYVQVDTHLRAKKENEEVYNNIFCIGDANGMQMLAHTAAHQALRVIDYIKENRNEEEKEKNKSIIDSQNKWMNKPIIYKNIPSVCYTNPELAFVGLTEKEAKQLYHPDNIGTEITYYKANSKILCENNSIESINVHKNNLYNKGKYNTIDNTSGMVKIIYKNDTKEILGVFIVGNYASIIIHEGVLAINMGLSVYDLAYMVHSHPTVSEVLDTAFKSIAQVRTH
ncbi:dihydrolipoamide dehydrogenase [Plasmodium gonderi]|uniref:Dihydrolipoamide dehydrogenase n=1 Tax=Plasmodium gonderi TaxID=77519 RepID=A0A1Y1JDI6_PLAGO|nr:dihydrolipoamide dehydrogenase [Plasmodium gonderi]GAW79748.1 dihydrolipoamide dehydrogenase [Plasmodium gonderi]